MQNTDYMQFFNQVLFIIERKFKHEVFLNYEEQLAIQEQMRKCFNAGSNSMIPDADKYSRFLALGKEFAVNNKNVSSR